MKPLRKTPHLPPATVARARALRREMTDAESRLWYALRQAFPSARFRHEVPLGPYYADFASHAAKLVIEADGGQHGPARDAERDRFIRGEGYHVLRFWNHDILQNLDGVLAVIAEHLPSPLVGESAPEGRMRGARRRRARASGSHPHPNPSPQGGGDKNSLE